MTGAPELVLASTSPYRRELLQRLLPDGFTVIRPDVDERPLPGEAPAALASRLAEAKAVAGAAHRPGSLVIASDQVAALGQRLLGKPGEAGKAREQLQMASGQRVAFHTAVCVLDSRSGQRIAHVDLTTVQFRELAPEEIDRYLRREPAQDCAGSFKSEGLGISLMQAIESRDPTGLQGLPLIWLASALRHFGLRVP